MYQEEEENVEIIIVGVNETRGRKIGVPASCFPGLNQGPRFDGHVWSVLGDDLIPV